MFRDQRKLVQKTMPPPAGRDGARPLQGARSRAVRPGRRGAPRVWLPPAKFRTEIWGVSHGHPALRKQHWWCLAVGRCGHRPLRREGEVPATTQASGAERSVCASGREEMGGNRSRDHPQRGHQRRTIPQSRRSRDSSLSTREPLGTGDADCRVASLLAMTVLILCHSEEAKRADVGIRLFYDGRGFGPPGSSAPTPRGGRGNGTPGSSCPTGGRREVSSIAGAALSEAESAERGAGQIRSLPDD